MTTSDKIFSAERILLYAAAEPYESPEMTIVLVAAEKGFCESDRSENASHEGFDIFNDYGSSIW